MPSGSAYRPGDVVRSYSGKTIDLGTGAINDLANTLLREYQYSSKSGIQDLVFGDKVRAASDVATGEPGAVYQFMGTAALGASADLAGENYADFGRWKKLKARFATAAAPVSHHIAHCKRDLGPHGDRRHALH